MYCKEISLKNGTILEDVHINKSKDYPEFIEVESEMEDYILINRNHVNIIVPARTQNEWTVQMT